MRMKVLVHPTLIVVAVTYGLLLTAPWTLGLVVGPLVAVRIIGLFAVLLVAILALSLWRYGYSVLRLLAQGHRELPAPGMEDLNPFREWRLALHTAAFPAALVLLNGTDILSAGAFGWLLRIAASAVLIFAFPASAALMGLTGRLPDALNPKSIAALIGSMGRHYAALPLASVAVAAVTALSLPGAVPWGGRLGVWLANALISWSWLALFALIGAALREQRHRFAIPGEVEPEAERIERRRRKEWRAVLDHVYASFRSGMAVQAYRNLDQLIDGEGESVEVYQWVFDQMSSWEDQSAALYVAVPYVARLLAADDRHGALKLFMRCRHLSGDFAIAPADALALADYARSIGYLAVAEELGAGRSA